MTTGGLPWAHRTQVKDSKQFKIYIGDDTEQQVSCRKASKSPVCFSNEMEPFLVLFFEGVVLAASGIGMAFAFSNAGGTVLQVGCH